MDLNTTMHLITIQVDLSNMVYKLHYNTTHCTHSGCFDISQITLLSRISCDLSQWKLNMVLN